MDRSPEPILETTAGAVRGLRRGGVTSYLGVPYAAAPVGDLRFRLPQPRTRWSGVRDATRPGPTPLAHADAATMIPEEAVAGDDVLNVNVFAPAGASSGPLLPVLLWLHGGGFTSGSPVSPWYDGSSFARSGVVVVTVAYRLGVDGFAWMADAPLNRGLWDQVAALAWVEANIERFGGDPRRITLAGQSAGGAAALALMTSPVLAGRLNGVIAQSANGLTRTAADAAALGARLAHDAGIEPTRSGWAGVSAGRLRELVASVEPSLPDTAPDPAAFAHQWVYGSVEPSLGPALDDDLLPCSVEEAMSHGVAAETPLLLGANAHEMGDILRWYGAALDRVDVRAALRSAGVPDALAERLDDETLPGSAERLAQLVSHRLYRVPVARLASARDRHSDRARTWRYDFDRRSPVAGLATHCAELPFAWDLLGAPGVRERLGEHPPRELAATMHGAWVDFITDPRREDLARTVPGVRLEASAADGELYDLERALAREMA
ncbi:carboxylesterase family protein [Microbacterium gorillae]|uniref:carboxylesterase family protein n=1 Tax=Microbacterium gorillae TaxID=1231063 RepID=UPI000694DB72|nr:carboxylesterase family protein [Microbacterium gorillae]